MCVARRTVHTIGVRITPMSSFERSEYCHFLSTESDSLTARWLSNNAIVHSHYIIASSQLQGIKEISLTNRK